MPLTTHCAMTCGRIRFAPRDVFVIESLR